jgi:hypothetical protein
MNNGYLEVNAKGHPSARKSGWIYAHRLAASEKIGRPLKPTEHVHHRDENKLNNSHENLIVFASNRDHVNFHNSGVLLPVGDGTYRSEPKVVTKENKCVVCCSPCRKVYCSLKCVGVARRKVERPPKEKFLEMVGAMPLTQVGRLFGVSDNAVRKWRKEYGIN